MLGSVHLESNAYVYNFVVCDDKKEKVAVTIQETGVEKHLECEC